ncbi:OmpH family outer membrane protein [Croceivirga radicis]|uniref:OmpH family outer membrane protein n=1 Tax=Croceivirga radicis TaxID=1929488 RepID=A0A1V6LVX5_9FLAO|nr:OmpH family outer membrane protein [Croceivirga radicis]OQD44265.1 hypothetical protein BUL40_01535 [Croceivirga radicis]
MKKLGLILGLVIMVSCQQNKIGFVDNVKLMDGYQEKLDVEADYKTKADKLNRKRDSISQAFQMEVQAFQTKANSMSQKKAQEEYGMIQQRGQMMGQSLQQEEQSIQLAGQEKMDSVVKKVKAKIEAYGKANGYTYILGGGEGGSVLYGEEANDLTEEVLKILNDEYKQ